MGRYNKKAEINPDKWLANARQIVADNVPCDKSLAIAKIARIIPWHVIAKIYASPESAALSAIRRFIREGIVTMDGDTILSIEPVTYRKPSAAMLSFIAVLKAGGIVDSSECGGLASRTVKTYMYSAKQLKWITFTNLPDDRYEVVWIGPDEIDIRALTRRLR